ncbi:MAG TPA: type I-U CRISPR-associated helicase/endonuclease Cas3, partial [Candidatus Synoicihabitans sp.]|nr:type I-U CRISPR-associated helicase/endonuclease Cas3 [Candidatus Synoicihabitans sp.]
RTLALLRRLDGVASPHALRELDPAARLAAFSPPPDLRPATDILFDAWSLTTIRETLPGRPPVAPYLHGEPRDWEPPETYVAWREEVSVIGEELRPFYEPVDLLADFPLKPHELLRDRSSRVRERLALLAEQPDKSLLPVWLVREDGTVEVRRLTDFAEKESVSLLEDATLLLPPSAGGLSPVGLLDGKTSPPEGDSLDVADRWTDTDKNPLRARVWSAEPEIPETHAHFRMVRVIDTWRHQDEPEPQDEAAATRRYWLWLEAPRSAGVEGTRQPGPSVTLDDHTRDVAAHARAIVQKLAVPERLAHCIALAAEFHDLGKKRRAWQRGIGNLVPDRWLAKAGRELRPREISEPYRHEFGSLRDAASRSEFAKLSDDERDLVLHLIAAHHGRGRPHFPADEIFDPESDPAAALALSTDVPRRFARLQRRYGRWGLAYLESLLRAADYAASAGTAPSKEVIT